MSDKIAAVVDVSGYRAADAGTPKHPVSELSIHSVQDERIPLNGSASDNTVGGWAAWALGFQADSQRATTDLYRRAAGATGPAAVSEIHSRDGATSVERTYVNPANGKEVSAITVPNLKHGWPGSSDSPNSFDASKLVIDWLADKHR